jgi:PadR family transcriptional regulator PadR
MYGYEVLREVERRSEGYFNLKEGTLYPALHRLERDNLIKGVWRTSPRGQYRRYYDISDRGLQRLEQGRAEWVNFSRAVNMVIADATP